MKGKGLTPLRTAFLGILFGLVTCSYPILPGAQSSTGSESSAQDELQGKFLVAQPQVNDPRFAKSIILLIDHSGSTGSMGLVINKVMGKLNSAEILENLELEPLERQEELPIFFGGPVELNHGFILHTSETLVETSRSVGENLAFSADAETVRLLISGKGPQRYLIAFGYAGWAPGQLETELERGDWSVMPADLDIVFTENPEDSWDLLMKDQVFRL
jgi:putative transcriptional regulator